MSLMPYSVSLFLGLRLFFEKLKPATIEQVLCLLDFHAACQNVLSKVTYFNWIVPPGAARTTAALHFDF